MKYCQHCGAQIHDEAVVCVTCGCSVASIYHEPDVESTGLNVLSFFIPIVGLILYIVFNNKTPLKAKAIGKWALIGVGASVGLTLFSAILVSSF